MIRINLAKTHAYAGPSTQTAVRLDTPVAQGQSQGLKIVSMILFLVLVIGYEKQQLSIKKANAAVSQNQLQAILAEIASFGSVTSIIEELEKEKKKVDEKLGVIESISKKRAFKLGIIMIMQENLPDDLWLEEMVVDKDLIHFKGLSRSPASIQQIVKKLEDNNFVKSAVNNELSRFKDGEDELQKFTIEARVKN